MISWIKADNVQVWIKETPTNHGPVTVPPRRDGTIREPIYKPDEISPRRHSVVHQVDDDRFLLYIGSVAYTTPYDSFDPNEVVKKFLNAEFQVLMAADVDLAKASIWDGSAQMLLEL